MGLLKLATTFLEERKKWKKSGSPTRSDDRIKELFSICSSNKCGQYIKISDNHGQCGICQCHLRTGSINLNKLAYATTKCPYDPPFWTEEPEFRPQSEIQELPSAPPSKPPVDAGCGCGGR